jgi:hypothetical protein
LDVKPIDVGNVVFAESPPMNIAMARHLARTKDLSSITPWGTAVKMLILVEHFARRAHRKHAGADFTMDVYRENRTAIALDLKLRLTGGWRPADDDEEVPASIQRERIMGVPEYLLGFPVAQAPKLVRYLFFIQPVKLHNQV